MTSFSLMRLALVAFAFVALGACSRNTATFVLSNDTEEPIVGATVEVNGERVDLRRIEPRARGTGTVAIRGDGDYHVTVRFQSGRVLDRRLGYVTSGFDFRSEFSVSETDVALKKSEATNPY
jgi:hypothetical protein